MSIRSNHSGLFITEPQQRPQVTVMGLAPFSYVYFHFLKYLRNVNYLSGLVHLMWTTCLCNEFRPKLDLNTRCVHGKD